MNHLAFTFLKLLITTIPLLDAFTPEQCLARFENCTATAKPTALPTPVNVSEEPTLAPTTLDGRSFILQQSSGSSGPCEVFKNLTTGHSCVRSPAGLFPPASCRIILVHGGTLFGKKSAWNPGPEISTSFTIGDDAYGESKVPAGRSYPAGTIINWATYDDEYYYWYYYYYHGDGNSSFPLQWELCFGPPVPTVSPTQSPKPTTTVVPTTAPTTHGSRFWISTDGNCVVDKDCITSPNFPGNCKFRVPAPSKARSSSRTYTTAHFSR